MSGSLAYALMTRHNLTEIREIVNSFIGQDESNLKINLLNKNFNKYSERKMSSKPFYPKSHENDKPNNNWQPRQNYHDNQQNNRTQQSRQNHHTQNESRQSRQRPEPMDVDVVSRVETNNIDDAFFIN